MENGESSEGAPSAQASDNSWGGDQLWSQGLQFVCDPTSLSGTDGISDPDFLETHVPFDDLSRQPTKNPLDEMQDDSFSWEIIELGLEEPLPLPEVIDELYETDDL